MNHIEQWQYPGAEKAYKAWRATVNEVPLLVIADALSPLTVGEQPRKYAGTGRHKRTAAHKETNRRGALNEALEPYARLTYSLTPTERARHAVTSYWATLTPEQRSERQRKAAKKMWKRRKAERRA